MAATRNNRLANHRRLPNMSNVNKNMKQFSEVYGDIAIFPRRKTGTTP